MTSAGRGPERIEDYALSVLLHDIGKFWERASDAPKPAPSELQLYCPRHTETGSFIHLHAALSARFIEDSVGIPGAERWGPRHHLPDPESREEICAHLADRLAAGDSPLDESRDAPHAATTPLRSPYGTLLSGERAAESWYLPLARQDQPEGAYFPRPVAPLSREDYRFHWNHFVSAADRLGAPLADLETWSALLEVFTSRIPSAATNRQLKAHTEIDLYSHSRVVAAIAVALYRGPLKMEDLAALSSRPGGAAPEEPAPVLAALVGGAVDGVERILSTGAREGGGTAQGMRGGALYLDLLTEAAARRLASRLGLPPTSILIAAEGRFVIVAPSGPPTAVIRDELDLLLREETAGELGLEVEGVDLLLSDFRAGLGGAWSRLAGRLRGALAARLSRLAAADHRRTFGPLDRERRKRLEDLSAGLASLGEEAAGARLFVLRRPPSAAAEGWRRILAALDFSIEPVASAAASDATQPLGDALAVYSPGRLDLDSLERARRQSAPGKPPTLAFRRWAGVGNGGAGGSARPSTPAVLAASASGLEDLLPIAGQGPGSLERILILSASLPQFFTGWAAAEVSRSQGLSFVQAGARGICVQGALEALAAFARELERGLGKLSLGLPVLRFSAAIAYRAGAPPAALLEECRASLRSLERREEGPCLSLFGEACDSEELERIRELAGTLGSLDRSGGPAGWSRRLRGISLLRRQNAYPERWRWTLEALLGTPPAAGGPAAGDGRRRSEDHERLRRLGEWLLGDDGGMEKLPLVLLWAENPMEGEQVERR